MVVLVHIAIFGFYSARRALETLWMVDRPQYGQAELARTDIAVVDSETAPLRHLNGFAELLRKSAELAR